MSGMEPMVIGADLSLTATGIASGAGVQVVRTDTRQSRMDRIHRISTAVIAACEAVDLAAARVFIEGYSYGSAVSQAHALGELGGIVRYRLWTRRVPYVEVPPASLKKAMTGKGNAKKPDMLDAARRAGYEGSNDDNAVDAWSLYQFGLYVLGTPQIPTLAYRDAVCRAFAADHPMEVVA